MSDVHIGQPVFGSSETPSDAQYKPIESQPPKEGSPGNIGPLPFSGAEVGILGGIGLLVTVTGLALQRAVRRPWQDPQG